jgi:hypothetical protein
MQMFYQVRTIFVKMGNQRLKYVSPAKAGPNDDYENRGMLSVQHQPGLHI